VNLCSAFLSTVVEAESGGVGETLEACVGVAGNMVDKMDFEGIVALLASTVRASKDA